MKKFKCQYRESKTSKEIEAESSEEAYKAFLDQEGIKPDYVYVSGGGLLSKTDTYEGHFDQNVVESIFKMPHTCKNSKFHMFN